MLQICVYGNIMLDKMYFDMRLLPIFNIYLLPIGRLMYLILGESIL